MKMNRLLLFVILAALLIAAVLPSQGDPFSIDWWTFDTGGGTSQDARFTLSGTIGQPDAGGTSSDGTFAVTGGFWFAPRSLAQHELYLPAVARPE